MLEREFISSCMKKVTDGIGITFQEAEKLIGIRDIFQLAQAANEITISFNGPVIDVEALLNAKSGNCPENCSFCSQSTADCR